jgi:hypothetical protein
MKEPTNMVKFAWQVSTMVTDCPACDSSFYFDGWLRFAHREVAKFNDAAEKAVPLRRAGQAVLNAVTRICGKVPDVYKVAGVVLVFAVPASMLAAAISNQNLGLVGLITAIGSAGPIVARDVAARLRDAFTKLRLLQAGSVAENILSQIVGLGNCAKHRVKLVASGAVLRDLFLLNQMIAEEIGNSNKRATFAALRSPF